MFNQKLCVAVTGGLGFIGSEVVHQLSKRDDVGKIVVIDNCSHHKHGNFREIPDLTNIALVYDNIDLTYQESEFGDLIEQNNVDVVYHLAALIGGIAYFHEFEAEIISDNTKITDNVIKRIIRLDSPPLLVYVSSSMIYEQTKQFPSKEYDIDKIAPPISAYGFSKYIGHKLCEAYHNQYDLKYSIAIPFNSVGPEPVGNEPGMSHVIPDFVKAILEGFGTEKKPLEIFGDGSQVRCYTHVSDIARGIIECGTNPAAIGKAFNIAQDKPWTVQGLAELIWYRIHGTDEGLHIKRTEPFKYDVKKRIPDISRAQTVLGWTPQYTLEDKIDEVIDFVKGSYCA